MSYSKPSGVLPTGKDFPELIIQKGDAHHSGTLINSVIRIGKIIGVKEAWWVDKEIPNVVVSEAKLSVEQNKALPFFLYPSYHDIHVPKIPNKRFVGKIVMGPSDDAIAQMDWCSEEIIKHTVIINDICEQSIPIHKKALNRVRLFTLY